MVWMPTNVMERIKDYIPTELKGKIATEMEAKNVDDLKKFLEQQTHPAVERWKSKQAEAALEATVEERKEGKEEATTVTVAELTGIPIAAGGFKIILKDAKIHAKKVIIRAEKAEKR